MTCFCGSFFYVKKYIVELTACGALKSKATVFPLQMLRCSVTWCVGVANSNFLQRSTLVTVGRIAQCVMGIGCVCDEFIVCVVGSK